LIAGPLELLFLEGNMKIICIHSSIFIYMVAVTRNVRTVWHQLVENYSYNLAFTLPASSSSKSMFESKFAAAAAGAYNPSTSSTWKSEKTLR